MTSTVLYKKKYFCFWGYPPPPDPGSGSKWKKVGAMIRIRKITDADPKHWSPQ